MPTAKLYEPRSEYFNVAFDPRQIACARRFVPYAACGKNQLTR
jgi:hypothetical protein